MERPAAITKKGQEKRWRKMSFRTESTGWVGGPRFSRSSFLRRKVARYRQMGVQERSRISQVSDETSCGEPNTKQCAQQKHTSSPYATLQFHLSRLDTMKFKPVP